MNDGGYAFPIFGPERGPDTYVQYGMSLLDWFAGQAAPTLRAMWPDAPDEEIAELAYDLADAMLKEREKRE